MKAALLLFSLSIFLCLAATPALAADLEHDLNSQYHDKILALRYPFTGDSQQFDSTGKPVNATLPGPWTVYGRVKIHHVHVRPDKLEIEVGRQGMEYGKNGLHPVDLHKKAKISVQLDHPLTSSADADALLNQIFAFTPEAIAETVPAFWRDYLLKPPTDHPKLPDKDNLPPGVERVDPKNGVKPPRATYTPEPEFSAAARDQRYDGTAVFELIISSKGEVESIKVLRPLGMGLDEQSAAAIKNWRFQPATKDGQPVPVVMAVEISFNFAR